MLLRTSWATHVHKKTTCAWCYSAVRCEHCAVHVHLCLHSPVGYRRCLFVCKRNISVTQKNWKGTAQKMINYRSLQSHYSNSIGWEGRRRLYNSRLRVCHSCEIQNYYFRCTSCRSPRTWDCVDTCLLHLRTRDSITLARVQKVQCEVFSHHRRLQRIFDRLYTKPFRQQRQYKNEKWISAAHCTVWGLKNSPRIQRRVSHTTSGQDSQPQGRSSRPSRLQT